MTGDEAEEHEPGVPDGLRFSTQPSTGDILWNTAALMRRSGVSIVVGTFATAVSSVAIVLGDRSGILFLVMGLSFLTGLFVVPFVWWGIRQRRDLVLASIDVEANAQGLSLTTTQGGSHQDWSVFRKASETSRAFMLDTGAGAVMLITKRGVDAADVDTFRNLLVQGGLLPARRTAIQRLRPLLWVAIGLAAAAALPLGISFIAGTGTTATMDLVPTVAGRTVTVRGTTDLPDGANVSVGLVQLDVQEQVLGGGNEPAGDPSDWLLYEDLRVNDGQFSATFNVERWAPGQVTATAYFWVDPAQPQAVIDRFGADGSGLYGPDVRTYDDGTISLEVQRTFELAE